MSKKNRSRTRSRVRAGVSAIALLGFVPALDRPGLAGQLLQYLHEPTGPAETKPVASRRIAILDPALLRQLRAVGMVVEGNQAFLISADTGARIPAPDGHYRLSDGGVVAMKDGRVLLEAQITPGKSDDTLVAEWRRAWKQWGDAWGQAEIEDEELLSNASPPRETTVAVTVREALTKIMET
jgi:hypothetical protein